MVLLGSLVHSFLPSVWSQCTYRLGSCAMFSEWSASRVRVPASMCCDPRVLWVCPPPPWGALAALGALETQDWSLLQPQPFDCLTVSRIWKCVDVDCGDKTEPELLIELFLLNKLNSRPPQNSRTRLRKGTGRKMCVSCATIFKSIPFAFFFPSSTVCLKLLYQFKN